MARKSPNNATKAAGQKTWIAGLYIRLSKEDGNDESLSVKNQRELLLQHIERLRQEDADNYLLYDSYIDDGMTGTDYDRTGFKRLLADVEAKKVNMVIVKDLSRPFRNYADQGYFLEEFFPRHDVRFISLGLPPLDSYRDPDMMNNIAVPIQGVINDNHCRETSLKVRQVFDMKRRRGQFIGAFAPYGYCKDPRDKSRFVVDEEAAQVVVQIFLWFLGGMSKNGIVHKLNELGVLCPSLYKRSKGMRYQNPNMSKQPLWSLRTVAGILKDQTYVGDMVQGRYRVKSYKIHTQAATPKEDWFIVEGTHEPVIARDIFEKALALQTRDTRAAPNSGQLYLFCGFLRCADCGMGLSRHTAHAGQDVRYYCSTYKNRSKAACTKHTIRHVRLEEAVLLAIQQQIVIGVETDALIAAVDAAPAPKGQAIQLDMQIKDREAELQKIARYQQHLYEDWKEGDISREEYRTMKEEYSHRMLRLNDILKNLYQEKTDMGKQAGTQDLLLYCLKQNGTIDTLTRELLAALVERVEVHEGGDIVIRFRFCDEYRRPVLHEE